MSIQQSSIPIKAINAAAALSDARRVLQGLPWPDCEQAVELEALKAQSDIGDDALVLNEQRRHHDNDSRLHFRELDQQRSD